MNSLLTRISRITTTGFYVPELDGLRALAILAVFLMHLVEFGRAYHFLPAPSDYLEFGVNRISLAGGLGVALFFAISGFIISIPFQQAFLLKEKPVNILAFYKRRLTRLEPPYFISLVILLLARLWLGEDKPLELVKSFFLSAFYVHNLTAGSASLINPVAWSLEIELQFYLAAPFLLFSYCSLKPVSRRAILSIFTILLIALRPESWRWQHSVIGVFEYFGNALEVGGRGVAGGNALDEAQGDKRGRVRVRHQDLNKAVQILQGVLPGRDRLAQQRFGACVVRVGVIYLHRLCVVKAVGACTLDIGLCKAPAR